MLADSPDTSDRKHVCGAYQGQPGPPHFPSSAVRSCSGYGQSAQGTRSDPGRWAGNAIYAPSHVHHVSQGISQVFPLAAYDSGAILTQNDLSDLKTLKLTIHPGGVGVLRRTGLIKAAACAAGSVAAGDQPFKQLSASSWVDRDSLLSCAGVATLASLANRKSGETRDGEDIEDKGCRLLGRYERSQTGTLERRTANGVARR